MRLQSQTSRKYEGKEYKKFWVVIPNHTVEKLGWKVKQELDTEINGDRLILIKK